MYLAITCPTRVENNYFQTFHSTFASIFIEGVSFKKFATINIVEVICQSISPKYVSHQYEFILTDSEELRGQDHELQQVLDRVPQPSLRRPLPRHGSRIQSPTSTEQEVKKNIPSFDRSIEQFHVFFFSFENYSTIFLWFVLKVCI